MPMMLGDLLAGFADESVAAETLLSLADLTLVAALRERAAAKGLEMGALAAFTVQRYAERASDEEWVTLMGELSRSPDPGLALLKQALRMAGAPCGA